LSVQNIWQISEDLAVTNSECSFNSIISISVVLTRVLTFKQNSHQGQFEATVVSGVSENPSSQIISTMIVKTMAIRKTALI